MRIFTPQEVAKPAGTKYLGVLVAAKFSRFINDFPRVRSIEGEKKLTTQALEALVSNKLKFKLTRRRRLEG